MRRAVFLLVIVMALGASLAQAGFEERQHTVGIGSLALAVDEEGAVDLVALDEPEPGFAFWDITVTYDPSVVSMVTCEAGHDGTCEQPTGSALRVFGADPVGLAGDVTIATITFRCEAAGTSALALEAIVSVLSIPEVIDTVEVRNGKITCGTAPPKGDVDCSGAANSLDSLLILQFHAALLDSLPCDEAADMNNDGTVSSIDAYLVLLHVTCPPNPLGMPVICKVS